MNFNLIQAGAVLVHKLSPKRHEAKDWSDSSAILGRHESLTTRSGDVVSESQQFKTGATLSGQPAWLNDYRGNATVGMAGDKTAVSGLSYYMYSSHFDDLGAWDGKDRIGVNMFKGNVSQDIHESGTTVFQRDQSQHGPGPLGEGEYTIFPNNLGVVRDKAGVRDVVARETDDGQLEIRAKADDKVLARFTPPLSRRYYVTAEAAGKTYPNAKEVRNDPFEDIPPGQESRRDGGTIYLKGHTPWTSGLEVDEPVGDGWKIDVRPDHRIEFAPVRAGWSGGVHPFVPAETYAVATSPHGIEIDPDGKPKTLKMEIAEADQETSGLAMVAFLIGVPAASLAPSASGLGEYERQFKDNSLLRAACPPLGDTRWDAVNPNC